MRELIKYMLLVLMVLAACKKADNRGTLFRIMEKNRYAIKLKRIVVEGYRIHSTQLVW